MWNCLVIEHSSTTDTQRAAAAAAAAAQGDASQQEDDDFIEDGKASKADDEDVTAGGCILAHSMGAWLGHLWLAGWVGARRRQSCACNTCNWQACTSWLCVVAVT